MIRAVLVLALAAGPAQALSCLRPDAVTLYETARDADEGYLVVRGRIDLQEPFRAPLPDTDERTRTAARLTGQSLTSHGFGVTFQRPIVIEAQCLGPWCAGPEGLKGEVIAALRVDDDALVLRLGPCGGDVVAWDKPGERRLVDCHRSGRCLPASD